MRYSGGAGGGAGGSPTESATGGIGVKCTLNGISQLYPNYYWGGGGGAATGWGSSGTGQGGLGGGGTGPFLNTINNLETAINMETAPGGKDGGVNNPYSYFGYGGHGGINTGGGGGGTQRASILNERFVPEWNANVSLPQTDFFPKGGYGGCGFVIIYNTDTNKYITYT